MVSSGYSACGSVGDPLLGRLSSSRGACFRLVATPPLLRL